MASKRENIKDFSFELIPAHTNGLANLVDRFQLENEYEIRDAYRHEPHLGGHLRIHDGWIDVYPQYISARLLSLRHRKNPKDSIDLINGPIKEKLGHVVQQLGTLDLATLKFSGKLETAEEVNGSMRVWRISSKPEPRVAHLRKEIREFVQHLGFTVTANRESDDVVHITLRGRGQNSGRVPAAPSDSSDLTVTFDKVGFTTRYVPIAGERYTREHCGATLTMNLGPPAYVYNNIVSSLADTKAWPPLPSLNRFKSSAHPTSATPPGPLPHVDEQDDTASQASSLTSKQSDMSCTSWVSAPTRDRMQGPRCFLSDALFPRQDGGLVPASSLELGDVIKGADGQPVKVVGVTRGIGKEFVELFAGNTKLIVTPTHRVMLGPPENSPVLAKNLQLGQMLKTFCGSHSLVGIRKRVEREEKEVFDIKFSPDKPVAAFHDPILTMGSTSRLRRGGVRKRWGRGAPAGSGSGRLASSSSDWNDQASHMSYPDTEYEYPEYSAAHMFA